MKKVILITGASSGIGKDGALRLLSEGHLVYGVSRRTDQMLDIIEAGGQAIELDLTNHQSINRVVEIVIKEQGRIDVLWNNAGYTVNGPIESVTYEEALRLFDVNLFGLAEMTKAVLPHMRKQKSGIIVNTSSVGGRVYLPLFAAWYHASKFALEAWSDCARMELKPFNIHVVLIEPGGIESEFADLLINSLEKKVKSGPYEKAVLKQVEGMKAAEIVSGKIASPSVISDVMIKILKAKRPRTRYIAGSYAYPMLWMRRLLSDRMYDKTIAWMMRMKFEKAINKLKK